MRPPKGKEPFSSMGHDARHTSDKSANPDQKEELKQRPARPGGNGQIICVPREDNRHQPGCRVRSGLAVLGARRPKAIPTPKHCGGLCRGLEWISGVLWINAALPGSLSDELGSPAGIPSLHQLRPFRFDGEDGWPARFQANPLPELPGGLRIGRRSKSGQIPDCRTVARANGLRSHTIFTAPVPASF